MDNIWLKMLELDDDRQYCDLLIELANYENAFARPVPKDFGYEDFEFFKKARVAMVTGEVFGRKVVPVNTYWVMSGSTPIGYATLKHEAAYDKPGGHIGCCLKKEYQNQGIGTIVSDILSSIAYHDLGITELVYSSKSENTQSQKSVDKIGGTLVAVNNGYHFYKVDLEKRFNNERRVIK